MSAQSTTESHSELLLHRQDCPCWAMMHCHAATTHALQQLSRSMYRDEGQRHSLMRIRLPLLGFSLLHRGLAPACQQCSFVPGQAYGFVKPCSCLLASQCQNTATTCHGSCQNLDNLQPSAHAFPIWRSRSQMINPGNLMASIRPELFRSRLEAV